MPEKFIIEGARALNGPVEVRGSKNAAGAAIAAALLTDKPCVIDNLPLVSDILNLLDILKEMGADVEWLQKRRVKVRVGDNVAPGRLDFEKFSRTRVSVLLIGALLARFREFKISRPGGDRIGLRPITTHLQALRELGAEIEEKGDVYYFSRRPGYIDGLRGKKIVLPEFSVTATENLMMAATLSKGQTIIKVAAAEPQVQDLGKMLKAMGAEIEGIGAHTLKIKGVKKLKAVEHKIIPDPLEAGTFIVIGALTPGRLLVKNVEVEHLELFLKKLSQMGVEYKRMEGSVEIEEIKDLRPVKIQALPYPGFPTDLVPLVVPLLTQAEGKSLIHDPLYENRLNYTHELKKMGADIEIVDPHRAFVFGKTALQGVSIESWDIRAGASLVVAGLMARGRTTINNVEQIDRGYEQIEQRLQQLGAQIKRVRA